MNKFIVGHLIKEMGEKLKEKLEINVWRITVSTDASKSVFYTIQLSK